MWHKVDSQRMVYPVDNSADALTSDLNSKSVSPEKSAVELTP